MFRFLKLSIKSIYLNPWPPARLKRWMAYHPRRLSPTPISPAVFNPTQLITLSTQLADMAAQMANRSIGVVSRSIKWLKCAVWVQLSILNRGGPTEMLAQLSVNWRSVKGIKLSAMAR